MNNKTNRGHLIKEVYPDSIAEEMEIEAGDFLISINDEEIEDVFDYRYLIKEEYIEVLIRKKEGEEWILEIEKDYDDDLGIEFDNSLMSDYRSCSNKCIFCFIDQMPPGMRETLYFKDDDSRLSFLQAVAIIDMIEERQSDYYEKFGLHFIHASDEWYITAERDFPEEERYDGYIQLENGVGMMRMFINEFNEELSLVKNDVDYKDIKDNFRRTLTMATGKLTYPTIRKFASQIMEPFPNIHINVVCIRNDFFWGNNHSSWINYRTGLDKATIGKKE